MFYTSLFGLLIFARQKSSKNASVVKVTASNFMADKHQKCANIFFFYEGVGNP